MVRRNGRDIFAEILWHHVQALEVSMNINRWVVPDHGISNLEHGALSTV
jgi:hypothetical protein